MKKDIFKKHQKEYCQVMINTYIALAKKHNQKIDDIITESFYYTNFSNVIITFTKDKKLISYKFQEVE